MALVEDYNDVVRRLTAAGAPFELRSEDSPWGPVRNFSRRPRAVRDLVREAGERRGDLEFVVDGARRTTFADFAALCWGAADVLTTRYGLRKGDRVAVLGPNSTEWLVAMFGSTAAGGIGVALNSSWSVEEVLFGVRDSGARFLVVEPFFAAKLLPLLATEAPDVETVFAMGSGEAPSGCVPTGELMVRGDAPPTVPIDDYEPFAILYSSGTSALPKGCITTHVGTITQVRGLILSGLVTRELASTATGARQRQAASLLTGPLFHVAGLQSAVGGSLVTGMKLVMTGPRFDPGQVLALIEQERITHWGAVPTVLRRVFGDPRVSQTDLSSLEAVSMGGAAVSPDLIEMVRSAVGVVPRLGNGWGLTETHGGVTISAGRDLAAKPGSVGRVHPYLDVRVADESFRPLPVGATGELLVRGPTVILGYWNRPSETADAIREGWVRTGDIGYQDEDGFVYLVDRASDLIIRGGENISSVEIENVLTNHPHIAEATVIGLPDPDLGERVIAYVRPLPGRLIDTEEVRAFVGLRLARFKVPSAVMVVDEPFPTNAAGKVMKKELRSRAAADAAEATR